jgi:CBS domain containing-hemolysin-like protein
LILTTIAAAAETVLTSLNRTQLNELLDRGVPRATAVESLLEDKQRSMATLLILNGLGLIGAASAATFLLRQLSQPGWVEFIVLYAVALIIIALAQIVPKAWAANHPEQVATIVAKPVKMLAKLLWPTLYIFDLLSRIAGQLVSNGVQPAGIGLRMTEEELRLLVGAGEEEGIIEEEEKEMIAGIFELGETLAREVMVPRINIVAVPSETPLLEALDVIIEAGHSRIPVYEDNIDNIVGVLYVKDMLTSLRDGQTDIPICDIVREPFYIPESKLVDDLLEELQQRKVHIAIVVDEYGGTAGLVTIEDLLEEIVGDIQDEYDQEEPYVEHVSDNEIIFDARIHLDDVNRLMSLSLPTEHSDTLGGLIFSELGKIPVPGEQVPIDGITIEVLSIADRRIEKVRVIRNWQEEGHFDTESTESEIAEGSSHSGLIEDAAT